MWLQRIIVGISVTIVKSWILPPGDFVSNFVDEHGRSSITIYLPQMVPLKWIKNNFVSEASKNIHPVSFIIPSLVANFSEISATNEELHIFVPDDKDKQSMRFSIETFIKIYGMRSNSRREHWLLDISYYTDGQKASNYLGELSTDLDDDLYWYTYSHHATALLSLTNGNQSAIELFEVYKINEAMNMTVNYYGNWYKSVGIKLVGEKKWVRRKNLKVVLEK